MRPRARSPVPQQSAMGADLANRGSFRPLAARLPGGVPPPRRCACSRPPSPPLRLGALGSSTAKSMRIGGRFSVARDVSCRVAVARRLDGRGGIPARGLFTSSPSGQPAAPLSFFAMPCLDTPLPPLRCGRSTCGDRSVAQHNLRDDAADDPDQHEIRACLNPMITVGRGAQVAAVPVMHDVAFLAVEARQASAAMENMIRAGTPDASLILGAALRGLVAPGCSSMLLVPLVATWGLFVAALPSHGWSGVPPQVVVARCLLMATPLILMRVVLCEGRCSGGEG